MLLGNGPAVLAADAVQVGRGGSPGLLLAHHNPKRKLGKTRLVPRSGVALLGFL